MSPEMESADRNCPDNEYLKSIRDYYDNHAAHTGYFGRGYRRILAHYYSHLIPPDASVLEIGCGRGDLLKLLPNRDVTGVDLSTVRIEDARRNVPYGTFYVSSGEDFSTNRKFDCIIVSDTVNEAADVQKILGAARKMARSDTRLILNFYNTLWKPVLGLGSRLGMRTRPPVQNWLSGSDVENLLSLSGWELIRREGKILCPCPVPIIANALNRLSPLASWACLTVFEVAKPRSLPLEKLPSVSVIIPARNEAGNIEAAFNRTPMMGSGTELIFVEGGSKDDTWTRIQSFEGRTNNAGATVTKILRQKGCGKSDAVREGFAVARGDIVMILDADLTTMPEDLPKFYDALSEGYAEFANGVRLVYPMEARAMRFLNMCANKFFGLSFTWLIGQRVKDTLCGTKVLFRRDYERIAANRAYFGDFDPFGDFDLLFGASKLNLKIADIPIRYKNRTYGTTNISRFSHGLLLFRMLAVAAAKLKFI
jgi:SAM-dependent methyltransferase